MQEINEKNERYKVLDEIRGFWLLNMIAYHTVWDLVYLFGFDFAWYGGLFRDIWRILIRLGFVLLSGYCWQMGKQHIKRGGLVFGGGLVVTVVTLIATPESRIIFGVLTFLGSAMLLLVPMSKVLEKIPARPGAFFATLLFVITYPVSNGYLGVGDILIWEVPRSWYANMFTTYLGFPEIGFWSTDYFGLFPWVFLYIAGYFVYTVLKKKDCLNWAKKGICPPLGFAGRHCLLIYMLHQPIIYGICLLLFA